MSCGDPTPQWIYESPDGGITVYRRLANSTERELIKVSLTNSPSEWVDRRNTALRRMRWYKMLDDAVDDPILSDMIERVEAYYALKY